MQININQRELTLIAVTWIAACGLGVVSWVHFRYPDLSKVEDRHGWSPEAAEMAAPIVGEMPPFAIVNDDGVAIVQDNAKSVARLWDAVKAVNGGQHLPNVPQQVGDCVSHACKHAVQFLICVQIAAGPQPSEFTYYDPFAPYFYGTSRVLVGKGKLKGDGSCGAWAARAVVDYGILRADFDGVPPYSGTVARQWGSSGPPQRFVDEARHFPISTTSPVRSAAEIRDAICNGYPVTIASNVGFDAMTTRDGKLIGIQKGSWSHAMCVIGYDGSGPSPLWCILNSWGPNAHGKCPDDAPPGSFWIGERDMDAIARQGDSFAYSGFKGFSAHEFNFNLFGQSAVAKTRPSRETAARKTTLSP